MSSSIRTISRIFCKTKGHNYSPSPSIPCVQSYRLEVSGSLAPQPDHVAGNAQHGGEGGEPTEAVRPEGIFIRQVFNRSPLDHVEEEDTNANCGRGNNPAELPPGHGVITDHILDSVVEASATVAPGNRDALEEHEEEQTESTDGVRVQDLEDVHSTLEVQDSLSIKCRLISRCPNSMQNPPG